MLNMNNTQILRPLGLIKNRISNIAPRRIPVWSLSILHHKKDVLWLDAATRKLYQNKGDDMNPLPVFWGFKSGHNIVQKPHRHLIQSLCGLDNGCADGGEYDTCSEIAALREAFDRAVDEQDGRVVTKQELGLLKVCHST